MSKFECLNCGECCGPIPLVNSEFIKIRKAIKSIPIEERERIKKQGRNNLSCILRDVKNKRCIVYSNRPLVCKQFGQVHQLKCPKNKNAITLIDGHKEIEASGILKEDAAGILSFDIGWNELEK